MRPLSRPRPRGRPTRRLPSRTTLLATAAALATFVFVQSVTTATDRARTRWGDATEALVATADLPPGHRVGPDDLTRVEVPRTLVPAGAVGADPTGRTIRTKVTAGEILLEHRLSGPGADGLAALLDTGQRGMAVPRSGADLALAPGDQVDVLATLDATAGGDPTVVLVERATVIAADAETVTLAVGVEDARTLTHALVTATVTLVLVG